MKLPKKGTKQQIINAIKFALEQQYTKGIDRFKSIQKGTDRSIKGIFVDGDEEFEFTLKMQGERVIVEIFPVENSEENFAEEENRDFGYLSDRFSSQLARKAAPLVEDLLGTVNTILEDSADLQEFSEKLLETYPDFDTEEITDLIASAMAASRLGGMSDANN